MNIVIDPLTGFYIIGAILMLAMVLLTLPTLIERSRRSSTPKLRRAT